ncbi:MAG: HlyD family efflux transporter periplasmic adaptor subunit [Pseudomonadota bacterium]
MSENGPYTASSTATAPSKVLRPRPNTAIKIVVVVSLLVIAVGGFAALKGTKPKPTPIEVTDKVWPVSTLRVAPRSYRPQLALFGQVESPHLANLAAALAADVKSVDALEGSRVKPGQVLVVLDDRDAGLQLAQREAELADVRAQIAIEIATHENDRRALTQDKRLLALSRRSLKRSRDLAKRNMAAQSQVDTSEQDEAKYIMSLEARELALRAHTSRLARLRAQESRAKALVDQASLDLERSVLTSPFEGLVTEVAVSPGDRVRVSDILVKVVNTDRLEVRAQIPSKHLPAVRQALAEGEPLVATAALDARDVSLRLDRFAAQATPGRGGVDALFRITGDATWIQLGRSLELLLALPEQQDVVAIPIEALYGTARVYVLSDNRLRGIEVDRIGEVRDPSGERRLLVRSAQLSPDSVLVKTQLPNAVEGLQVREVSQPDR